MKTNQSSLIPSLCIKIINPTDRKTGLKNDITSYSLKNTAYHICTLILFPSTTIVFILKSIPVKEKDVSLLLYLKHLEWQVYDNPLMSTTILKQEDFLVSLPIVDICDLLNSLLANRQRIHVFPTPESPISKILNK